MRTPNGACIKRLHDRFYECGLELNRGKTRVIYRKDDDRKADYPEVKFDFLGMPFCPTRSENRYSKFFINFTPGGSSKVAKAMRNGIQNRRIHVKPYESINGVSRNFNPAIRGWINRYARFHNSSLRPVLRHMNRALIHWAREK